MKLLGSILLAVGFFAGTFVTVNEVATVNWTQYGICAVTMVLGMALLRLSRKGSAAQSGEKHAQDMNTLQRSLTSLLEKVRTLESDTSDEAQLEMHGRIDSELMEDIHDFVEARESMIPHLGMQSYANIMSPFASGERLLNRAWSASADGYVDEVRVCVAGARSQLEKAKELLGQATG